MIACTSPPLMVRSTPLRISFGPDSVFTETCRSRISSVDISISPTGHLGGPRGSSPRACSCFVLFGAVGRPGRCVEVDEHVVADHLAAVDRDRLGGREAEGLPGLQ